MKRKTKDQREQEAKDALYQRVCDIMAGACQGDDPESTDYWVGAQVLPDIVRGVVMRLLPNDYKEKSAFLTSMTNADEYENAVKLTDFLFRNGVRA
jgi:hypothetical protein